ncbi:MAG: hypothetical protein WCD86_18110 [Ktedonobacteraceae bacterium]
MNLNSGCDPNTNQSIACHAWAYDAGQVQKKRIDSLTRLANLEMLGAGVLMLLGDLLAFFNGAEPLFQRLDAAIQIVIDLAMNILPYLGAVIGGSFYEDVLHFDHWASVVLAGVKTVLAGLNSQYWWISDTAQIAGTGILDTIGGPTELIVQGVMVLTKPAIGYLLGAGSYILQEDANANFAEVQRESDMPIQDWCEQYGGCPSYSSY